MDLEIGFVSVLLYMNPDVLHRLRRLLPRDCGDTISWLAGCVEKAQPNAIDMPCDTKA